MMSDIDEDQEYAVPDTSSSNNNNIQSIVEEEDDDDDDYTQVEALQIKSVAKKIEVFVKKHNKTLGKLVTLFLYK